MKYIHDQNVWGAWVGGCWDIQSTTKDTLVKSQLNKLNEELWERIAGMSNPLRQQMIQFAKKCETNKNMDAVISITIVTVNLHCWNIWQNKIYKLKI